MKIFFALCTVFALLTAVPAPAKEAKKTKRELKEEKEKKEKEEKAAADAAKEILYSAVIKPLTGDATDSDVARVKGLLSVATMFKTKNISLVEKDVVATLVIHTGRLSKSDVAKMLKDGKETKYRLDRLDDIKPEKEKKDGDKEKEKEAGKPGDKKEEMKKDEKKDPKEAPKDTPKPGTPPPTPAATPTPAPAAAETPPPKAKE